MHARLKQPRIRFYLWLRLSNTEQLSQLQKKRRKMNLRGYLNTTQVFLTENFKHKVDTLFLVCVRPLELISVLHSRTVPSVSLDPRQLTWIVIRDALWWVSDKSLMKVLLKALPECYPESCCLVSLEIRTQQGQQLEQTRSIYLAMFTLSTVNTAFTWNTVIGRMIFDMFDALEVFSLVELVQWTLSMECVVLKGEKWDQVPTQKMC